MRIFRKELLELLGLGEVKSAPWRQPAMADDRDVSMVVGLRDKRSEVKGPQF